MGIVRYLCGDGVGLMIKATKCVGMGREWDESWGWRYISVRMQLANNQRCCCNVIVEALDDDADFDVPVDIFAIGFEEIVDLSAGNIMSARSALCNLHVNSAVEQ